MNKMSLIKNTLLAISTAATLFVALPSQAADYHNDRNPSQYSRYHGDDRHDRHDDRHDDRRDDRWDGRRYDDRYDRRVDYREDRYGYNRHCDTYRYGHDDRYRRDWDRHWH